MTDCTLLYVPVVMSHRDSNHTEIDILIKENEQLTAIEVIYHIILIMKKNITETTSNHFNSHRLHSGRLYWRFGKHRWLHTTSAI